MRSAMLSEPDRVAVTVVPAFAEYFAKRSLVFVEVRYFLNRLFGLLHITMEIRLYLHPLYEGLTTSGRLTLLPFGIVVEPYL